MTFHLVLVHGTGARQADWTKPEKSGLCKHLKGVFGDRISFSRPEWGGRNTYQDRIDGARALRDELPKNHGDGRVTILVGHSHGGSLIAHALAEDEALCRQVGGVVFMATPFVQARALPLGRHLPMGPSLLAGLLSALAFVGAGLALAVLAGWPENPNRALDIAASVLPYAGFLVGWVVFNAVCRFLGVSDGLITEHTHQRLAVLLDQLDLGALAARGINRKALVIRSTADEAAGVLGAAQLFGRIASDVPALTWKLPQRIWGWLRKMSGLDADEPPRWAVWTFLLVMFAVVLGVLIQGAAWLSGLPLLQQIDAQVRQVRSSVEGGLFSAFVVVANGLILFLLLTVPLLIVGLPLKLAGLWAYGLRGWPMLLAFYVELSVEPAPPGRWRIHQLDARHHESAVDDARQQRLERDLAASVRPDSADIEGGKNVIAAHMREAASPAQGETTLAHSYVYDDPRAHRAIAEWLEHLSGSAGRLGMP